MATGGERLVLDDAYTRGRFNTRVAVVTGGASGIGKATVERFVNDGSAVHMLDVNEEVGREIESRLRNEGHDVTFHKVDVSSKAACEEVAARVAKSHGRIHMLFNSAGVLEVKGLDATESDWRKLLSINVEGTSNMVQSCYPYMNKGDNCSVVNMTSGVCYRASLPNLWTYSTSKGAVLSLSRCMALDLSEKGVRVNSLSPSIIWTPMVAGLVGTRDNADKIHGPTNVLGRIGNPEEVAATVAFLCSRDARFITGVDIPVDGGYLIMGVRGRSDIQS